MTNDKNQTFNKNNRSILNDYVSADILYLFLFKNYNLVIRPFEYAKNIAGFINIMEILYTIEEIDISNIYSKVQLTNFLDLYSSDYNKTLFLFNNPTQEIIESLGGIENIRFCIYDKVIDHDYSKISNIIIYNKKLADFDQINPQLSIDKEDISYIWVQEKITNFLKLHSFEKLALYIKSIKETIDEIYNLLVDFNERYFYLIMKKYSLIECKIIIQFCEKYHMIDTKYILPQNLDEFLQKIKTKLKDEDEIENEIEDEIEDQLMQDYNSLDSIDLIDNSKFLDELLNLDGDSIYKIAFSETIYQLKIQNNSDEKLSQLNTPEELYCYFRKNFWDKSGPSFSFFEDLLLFLTREKLKKEKTSLSGLQEKLRMIHNDLCIIFEEILPKSFKNFLNLDFKRFSLDNQIQSVLIDEDSNSKYLPFLSNQVPRKIEKIFIKKKKIHPAEPVDLDIVDEGIGDYEIIIENGIKDEDYSQKSYKALETRIKNKFNLIKKELLQDENNITENLMQKTLGYKRKLGEIIQIEKN